MRSIIARAGWALLCVVAALALGVVATHHGEPVNSLWLVLAAACLFLIGFRFYAKFIAAKVMVLDDRRATPAERFRDGHDYEPTNKWILLGHHFAAIAGPGPLVGPTLAAQFGYLPGTLWILFGCVLGGAVQDFVILFCSMRRDGKTLGQMARDEIGKFGGFISLITVLLIMIVLLAVVALVVVNALKSSPWGTFTIAMTIPIAVFMGVYLRYHPAGEGAGVLRHRFRSAARGRVRRERRFGIARLGALVHFWRNRARRSRSCVYGFLASVLPVWLLLAPRDYLSTFVKLGVIFLLAIGIFVDTSAVAAAADDAIRGRNGTDLRG